MREVYAGRPMLVVFRSREEIEPAIKGWKVVESGLLRPELWRIDELGKMEELRLQSFSILSVLIGNL
ncbi:hypothetical protein GQ43DRAFT_440991 [Delitschia confertaspora ATCC 74209]|uniref:Uncharacterized protein n=1 Tax=Delitschia confertaspora ATCC 74209 TaxID=1513339 RepID=A0A9P4MYL1_9PLEO|nr:hypothetical protein GQ43DRAFT_440991 [Delitschia confertaspora ATCC 74209]